MLSHSLPAQRQSDRGTSLIQPSTLSCRLARRPARFPSGHTPLMGEALVFMESQ